MSHADAMSRFGSDKPDLRFDNEIVDLTDLFSSSSEMPDFLRSMWRPGRSVVKAISFSPDDGKATPNEKQLKKIELVAKDAAKHRTSAGPVIVSAFFINAVQNVKSSLLKKCPPGLTQSVMQRLGSHRPGDFGLIVFACEDLAAAELLGLVRSDFGGAAFDLSRKGFSFLWVEDFPLFCRDEDGDQDKLSSSHHPFTRPKDEDLGILDSDPLSVRGEHYDLVLNGQEVGGGSIRIHEAGLQVMRHN